ncbi:MAG: hypothetical protein IE933_01540 [Sphingomonadales bacterium]|nr:hypothetical protein [Sphingomonadales bacterium]MBD3771959.1 hypothetical protein [Paracoccaceae bacterium]
MVVAPLAACDGATGADARQALPQSIAPVELAATTPAPLGTPAARAAQALTEYDRNALEMAKRACDNRDFNELFTAMAISPVVLRQYSAPTIAVSLLGPGGKEIAARQVPIADYTDFPVTQVDYYYKPAKPLKAGDEEEYLDLQFNQSQSDDFSVEWARVHYDGQSSGGDDLGNIIGADGRPLAPGEHPDADGQLLFRPVGNCWRLEEDIRWRR